MNFVYTLLLLVGVIIRRAYGQMANCDKYFIEDSQPGYWYSLYPLDLNGVPYNMEHTNLSDWISHLGFFGTPIASGNTKSIVINSLFSTAPSNGVQYGDIFGNNITMTNFSMVVSAWYIPYKTGYYNFTLMSNSAGKLSITNNTSAYCCNGATNRDQSEQFSITSIPSMPEAENPSGRVYLYAGFKYQMLMSFINLNSSAYFYIESRDPVGNYINPDWFVQQMNKQNSSELVTCNYSVGYTTATVPWTGLSTIEETQQYYKILSGGYVTFQVWDLIGTPYGSESSISHLTSMSESSLTDISSPSEEASELPFSVASLGSSTDSIISSPASIIESLTTTKEYPPSNSQTSSDIYPFTFNSSVIFSNSDMGFTSSILQHQINSTIATISYLPLSTSQTPVTSTNEGNTLSNMTNITSMMSSLGSTNEISNMISSSIAVSPSILVATHIVSSIPMSDEFIISGTTANSINFVTSSVLPDLNGIAASNNDNSNFPSSFNKPELSLNSAPKTLVATTSAVQAVSNNATYSSDAMSSSDMGHPPVIPYSIGLMGQNNGGTEIIDSDSFGEVTTNAFTHLLRPTESFSQTLLSEIVSESSWITVPPATITVFSSTGIVTTLQLTEINETYANPNIGTGDIPFLNPNRIRLDGLLPEAETLSKVSLQSSSIITCSKCLDLSHSEKSSATVSTNNSSNSVGIAHYTSSHSISQNTDFTNGPPIVPLLSNGAPVLSSVPEIVSVLIGILLFV